MQSEKHIGLTDEEVKANREEFGNNSSGLQSNNRLWYVIKEVIFEPLFIILVCTALIYFILGDLNECLIMFGALFFVSGISIYQENKSGNALDELKKISSPYAKVIRDGNTIEIPFEGIVMHDLIIVEDGFVVPADAIILEAHDFSVNESMITGEALPVVKNSESTENKIFRGTMIMTGSCIAEVIAVGKQTVLGKLGKTLQETAVSKTPLQIQIRGFVRSMVSVGVAVFFIVWGINYYIPKSILNGLLHGLTLAMSILPEEIPVAFSTFMALGAYHLYKQKIIVRSVYTVETLGAATVICTDKTGTITENKMQLSAIYDFSKKIVYDYTVDSYSFNNVLEYAMWSSEIDPFDPMEKSIHAVYTSVAEVDKRSDFKMIHEYPLGGKPPIMTHVFSDKQGTIIIACKGSVEGVLNQCILSFEEKSTIKNRALEFALKGFRVLAVAKSNQNIDDLPSTQFLFEFDFIGLVAFYDPPKSNIKEVLHQFYQAGIDVKMITGDYSETAISIANQIGLKNSSSVLTGSEIAEMNVDQLREKVKEFNIYARMFPEAKLQIIEALKDNGEIVAMTGDGVNDGPALKASHIGIAMGMRGSEIAKQSASLVLMDDDLSHMVYAIETGRKIYENLKKAIRYIISIHIPIILIVTLPLLLFWKFTNFLSPVHVIFLELIMGPTCSLVFEKEPVEANSMKRKPRKMNIRFFSFNELFLSIIQGLIITSVCLGLGYCFMLNGFSESMVRTIIYATLIFSNLFLTLVNRSFYYSVFTTIRYKNNLLPIVLIISIVVLILSIYVKPIRELFQFEALKILDMIMCFVVAFLGVIWVEVYKLFLPKIKNQS